MNKMIRNFAIGLLFLSLLLITASCGGSSQDTTKTFTTSMSEDAAGSVIALNSIVSVGAVGDVKYSILEPDKFTQENGDGWVLMEGQDIKGTDLWKLTGIETLPDARGVFLRGLNRGRNKEEGDAEGDRQVGSSQDDTFENHSHPVGPLVLGWNTEGNNGKHRIDTDDGGSWGNPPYDVEQIAKPVGKEETRPRNIALFTYIKVSNPHTPEPSPTAEPSASASATPQ